MTDPDGVDVLEYDGLDRLSKVTRYAVDGVTQLGVEEYAYNALGALKRNAGVALDDQRPRLDGQGLADAAVPATHGGQPVTLNAGGLVTTLLGASFGYSRRGYLQQALPPIPQQSESYAVDATQRRVVRQLGPTDSAPPAASDVEFYVYEGLDRVATLDGSGAVKETYLFDGVDHPLRVTRGSMTAYYELDLAGNVRGLRASGGADLGGYRYTAFGKTVEDTATSNFDQPLRWKGRWFSNVAGGIYDVRARQWSPELGTFLAVDEFIYANGSTTLWGWPNQNPVRHSDFFGHGPVDFVQCLLDGNSLSECLGDQGERLQSTCDRNPNACKLMGGMPGRGGPHSGDEGAIRTACRQEGEIAYADCLRKNHEAFFPKWACRNAAADAERECLEKAGLKPDPLQKVSPLPCIPLGPVPLPAAL